MDSDEDIYTTIIKLPDGSSCALEAPAGWRLMEVIRDYGLPIRAECGGACACATCHVHVEVEAGAPLVLALDDEIDRLDESFEVDNDSRLSCQILTGPQTDGLVVRLANDALIPGYAVNHPESEVA